MSERPKNPSRAVVRRGSEIPANRVEAPYRVESEPGWSGVREVFGIFRRHVWLIAIITALSLAFSAWLVTREVPKYRAYAIIRLIDRQPGTGRGGMLTERPVGTVDPVLSELVVLSGRTVIGQTVDREGWRIFDRATREPASFLDDVVITLPPEARGTMTLRFGTKRVFYGPSSDQRTANYGERVAYDGLSFVVPSRPRSEHVVLDLYPRETAIDNLIGSIVPIPNASTGAIQVSYTSTDPRLAPQVVNAIVEVYKEVNADMERENVRMRRAFLEAQLRETDSLMMVAQAGLSGFRSQEQAYSAAGRFSAEQGNLIQVEIEQARLQADLRMYQNAYDRIMQARNSGQQVELSSIMSLPGLAGDPAIGPLYSQLVQHRAQREEMVAGPWARAPSHPEVRRLDSLISGTEERLVAAIGGHLASLRAQIGALGALRGRASSKMSDLPRTEVQEVYLTQNVTALQQMGDQLRDQYQAVRLEEAAETGLVEIVQQSRRSIPIPSRAWIKIMLGLVVGLMLGSGAAVGRELFDDSINTPEDMEDILLVPNLAVIPEAAHYMLDSKMNGHSRRTAMEPPGTEAYRILRTNLLFSEGGLKTLVVTSAAPGEGKTMTSVNLAVACARQGLRILLMECDLRRPAMSRFFESPNEADLTGVLVDGRPWREAVRGTEIPGLDVVLAGKAFPRATEFFSGPRMRLLLSEMSEAYDMVILDTSPLLVAADATVLGAITDGVLMVVRATSTDRKAVEQAVHQLTLVGANVVGTVLNDPDGSVARYGHYYDYSAEYEVQ